MQGLLSLRDCMQSIFAAQQPKDAPENIVIGHVLRSLSLQLATRLPHHQAEKVVPARRTHMMLPPKMPPCLPFLPQSGPKLCSALAHTAHLLRTSSSEASVVTTVASRSCPSNAASSPNTSPWPIKQILIIKLHAVVRVQTRICLAWCYIYSRVCMATSSGFST